MPRLELSSFVKSARYGRHGRMRLDLYAPTGRARSAGPAPTVLFFYGGSWKKGDRRLYRPLGLALAAEGYATAIADYRLYPEVSFPEFMEDAASAFSWVKAFAEQFGGDPNNITVMGHSAGAHMGALLALDPTYLENENLTPQDMARFVGLAGPYSIDLARAGSVAPIFETMTNRARTRPIKLVAEGPQMPPSLLLHGRADKTVHWKNTENFATAIGDRGGHVETAYFNGIGHVGLLLSLAPGLRWRAPSWDRILAFLEEDTQHATI